MYKLVLLVLIPTITGVPEDSIVGGIAVEPYELPYQVSIQIDGSHFCGGVIYNKDYIITAAHCVVDTAPAFRVVAGEHSLLVDEGIEQRRSVSNITVHEEYNTPRGRFNNDIAMFKLSSPLDLNSYVAAIKLPTENQDFSASIALVSGWGYTSEDGEVAPTLRKVNVPTMTDDKCREDYPGRIAQSMLCAGYAAGGKDSCSGDSGGPLVVDVDNERILAGIVSWGVGCARRNSPGVYTEVSYFLDFITRIANASNEDPTVTTEATGSSSSRYNLNSKPLSTLLISWLFYMYICITSYYV